MRSRNCGSVWRRSRRRTPAPTERSASTSGKSLQAAVEELLVAKEELRAQNEELMATRLEVEAERQRYHDLFEFAPDAYLVTDVRGVVQEANRAAAAMLNTRRNGLVGKPLVLFVAPEERPTFHARLERAGRGEPSDRWEMGLQPRDQSPLTGAVAVTTVHDARARRPPSAG